MTAGDPPPVLRVVRGGEPSAEELAALVAAVAARPAAEPPEDVTRSRWADRQAMLRTPLHPGPGAWQAAARR